MTAHKRSRDNFLSSFSSGGGFGFCSPCNGRGSKHIIGSQDEKNIQDFLQNNFDKLSLDEQEKVYQDLYGIEETISEDDVAFVHDKVNELQMELDIIPPDKKKAYEQAKQSNNSHVHFSENNMLKFLRVECFDAKKAAKRIVVHWKWRLKLFGPYVAFKDTIRIDDLSSDDMESFQSGGLRILDGVTDRAGRGKVWSRGVDYGKYQTKDNLNRIFFYQLLLAANDENLQDKGLVAIMYGLGYYNNDIWDKSSVKELLNICTKAMPIRIFGFHHCFNDWKLRAVVPAILMFMSSKDRARYKTHSPSTHQECLFELMCYGIPADQLPIDDFGNTKKEKHLEWIEQLKKEGR